jgi:hypothetical protein
VALRAVEAYARGQTGVKRVRFVLFGSAAAEVFREAAEEILRA